MATSHQLGNFHRPYPRKVRRPLTALAAGTRREAGRPDLDDAEQRSQSPPASVLQWPLCATPAAAPASLAVLLRLCLNHMPSLVGQDRQGPPGLGPGSIPASPAKIPPWRCLWNTPPASPRRRPRRTTPPRPASASGPSVPTTAPVQLTPRVSAPWFWTISLRVSRRNRGTSSRFRAGEVSALVFESWVPPGTAWLRQR
jgi:hypothetical protein